MTSMRMKYYERPYLSLLPFLVLYLLIVIFQNSDSLVGDESRYIQFAQNLLNGFYSPPPPDINLWNGPGYPFFLVPFVKLGIPPLFIRMSNAFMLYGALLLFNKSLSSFVNNRHSFHFTLIFACYYMPFKSLPFILTETLTLLLISCITLLVIRYFSADEISRRRKLSIVLIIVLSFLVMTKVVFGMVILVASGMFLLIYFVSKNKHYIKACLILLTSFALCLPYLAYTYSLTGKLFYWSNAAGMSAYWMSTPAKREYGNWHNDSLTSPPLDPESLAILRSNHKKAYQEIYSYKGVQRDEAFKEYAIRNVKENPAKYFQNWLANWSRLFFNYPVSYVPFHSGTMLNLMANLPILFLIIFSSILTLKNRSKLPFAFTFLLCLFGIYLVASSFLSAYDRMFYILSPVFMLWIVYSILFFWKGYLADQKSK